MPYIKKEQRKKFDDIISNINCKDSGELNYVITNICLSFIKNKGLKYDTLNTICGVLKCVWDIINERIAKQYEKKKQRTNGDLDSFEKLIRDYYLD